MHDKIRTESQLVRFTARRGNQPPIRRENMLSVSAHFWLPPPQSSERAGLTNGHAQFHTLSHRSEANGSAHFHPARRWGHCLATHTPSPQKERGPDHHSVTPTRLAALLRSAWGRNLRLAVFIINNKKSNICWFTVFFFFLFLFFFFWTAAHHIS